MPMMENGTAAPGISVAERLRRNRKITITTMHTVSSRVNSTSRMESRMDSEASNITSRCAAGGTRWRNSGNSSRMPSTTSTVLVPGCFWMARMMPCTLFEPGGHLFVVNAIHHTAELLQPHRRAVAPGHDDRPVIGGLVQRAVGFDGEGLLVAVQAARRQVRVAAATARCTSSMPMSWAANSSGSTSTRTAYFCSP